MLINKKLFYSNIRRLIYIYINEAISLAKRKFETFAYSRIQKGN